MIKRPPYRMKPGDGRTSAITYAPRLAQMITEYERLNTREARVAFVDLWLTKWAEDFELTWPIIYRVLDWIEREKLYQDSDVIQRGEVFADFKSYFEARLKRPFTAWVELEKTHSYLTKYAPEMFARTFSEAQTRADEMQARNAKDVANQRPAHVHIKRDVDNDSAGVNVRPTGNSAAAALRRLRKDRLDIHARVLAGEISAHAGMIEAGFRKPRAKRPTSALHERVTKMLGKLTLDELRDVRTRIDRMLAAGETRSPAKRLL